VALNDAHTFKLLKACKSTAVFQLESHGMRDLIKRLQPDCFEDLIALVALFRPGPLQSGMVDDFINRKHGRAKIAYPHEKLEPVLRPTYGVIVYQEQVMQIAQVLAGYTLGAADILRRAMGKKKPEEMAKQREIFCSGADAGGIKTELANQIFDLMEKFAGYGFNKSHSAAYALIAYQTAWLKAHYPAEFMAAVLSSDLDKTEKVIILLDECEAMKLHVAPPDINKSNYMFNVIDDNNLMYGLGAIKGVGEAAIENIVAARAENGPFTDLFNFCQRIDLRKSNRRVLEALIKAGCFDSLGTHRASLMKSLNNALQHAEQALHNMTYGQGDLLSIDQPSSTPNYLSAELWPDEIQLQGEKETLGFYLTGHPIRRYLNELANFTTCRLTELHPSEHKNARVAGIIANIRTRQTKRGDRIGIFSLDDGTTQIEVVCFSEAYQKYRHLLVEDQMVVIDGEVSLDEFSNSPRIVARDLMTIEQSRDRFAKQLRIQLPISHSLKPDQLKQVLLQHRGGQCGVVVRYLQDNIQADVRLGKNWLVKPTDTLIHFLQDQFGIETVEFVY
jgi:DNA polymerase-3 subunit alpha